MTAVFIFSTDMVYRKCFLLLLLATVFASTAQAVALRKSTVKNAEARQAVCNDGSPAIYYFRKGSGEGSRNWVIFLSGGGFCYSVDHCDDRKISSPELMTSIGKPATLNANGILSDSPAENPDFYNANHVAVPYCSSDLWSGNREKSQSTGGHEFRGWRIVRELMKDFKNGVVNADIDDARKIVFTGTSAGGVGVMVHADWLSSQFPSADVRGINDAGWIPDVLPSFSPGQYRNVEIAHRLWNGKVDKTCADANQGTEYRCYSSSVYPFLKTPLLVQISQYDSVYLGAVGVRAPFDAQEAFLANLFASAVRDSLQPVQAAFSPKTHTHGMLPYNRFFSIKINGKSLRDIVGNWIFDRSGPVKVIK